MSHKIIFDTDPGIDDAMALLFAHRSPAIELLGITTVVGNASLDVTTRNALHIVERFDLEVEVYRGAAQPLVVPVGLIPTFVHGDDGLGNINPPTPAGVAAARPAAAFIVDTVTQHPGEVTVVAVGRLTNLALALKLEPAIAGRVKQVVVMGGALGVNGYGGNVSPCAEANIAGDPHAADVVFGAAWPVTMVGLDVTMQVVMEAERMARIRAAGGPMGAFVYDIARFYTNFYRTSSGRDGFPVHDSSAVAYAIDPSLFETRAGAIRVVDGGIAVGQTIQAPSARKFPPSAWDERPAQRACVGVDAERLLTLYETTLCDT